MGEKKKQEVPQPSAPLCDFSVRIYEEWEPGAYRVQVTGNRTGRTASAETGRGIQWVFALLRALKEAGAYDERGAEGIQQASDELSRLRAEVAQLREERDRIIKELGLEWEDYGDGEIRWWLPAEPGPVDCDSIAEAVREANRLADNDVRRAERLAEAAEDRATRLEVALRDAWMLVIHAVPDAWDNGNTGEDGTLDEGAVAAAEIMRRIAPIADPLVDLTPTGADRDA